MVETTTNQLLYNAAALDALAMVAPADVIEQAASILDRCEMRAWGPDVQESAARELRALAEAYHE